MQTPKRLTIVLALFFICCIHHTLFAQQAKTTFTSIELQPTTAYLNDKGKESRMGRLVFHGGKSFDAGELTVSLNGIQEKVPVPASAQGLESFDVPFPAAPIDKETQATVRLSASGKIYEASCLFAPAKKWTVYV